MPYQTLAGLFTQLQKLRQASDVLRRTSRFVTLARRLESQMKEMDSGAPAVSSSLNSIPSVTYSDTLDSSTQVATTDDENARERAIARAALSIAELCKWILYLVAFGCLY